MNLKREEIDRVKEASSSWVCLCSSWDCTLARLCGSWNTRCKGWYDIQEELIGLITNGKEMINKLYYA
ncbi:MAG: hypothetical protein HY790_03960 [Deltaproteobacteria bacterium]|nr:hypothetical protein [Deltaproteobacteria bacterium]